MTLSGVMSLDTQSGDRHHYQATVQKCKSTLTVKDQILTLNPKIEECGLGSMTYLLVQNVHLAAKQVQ